MPVLLRLDARAARGSAPCHFLDGGQDLQTVHITDHGVNHCGLILQGDIGAELSDGHHADLAVLPLHMHVGAFITTHIIYETVAQLQGSFSLSFRWQWRYPMLSSPIGSAVSCAVQAYADYQDLMEVTENMISQMVLRIKGSYKIQYHADGPERDPIEIDFTPPWRRISMVCELEKILDVTIPKDLYSEEARAFLEKLCADKNVDCKPPQVRVAHLRLS